MPMRQFTEAERVERFWERVNRRGPDECWYLHKSVAADQRPLAYWGYVKEPYKRALYKVGTHVVIYSQTGRWPTYVEHTCDDGHCLNPAHLLESDHQANMASMIERQGHWNSRKTHCRQGHPYEVYARAGRRGNGKPFRICKACERIRTWARRGDESSRGPARLTSPTWETDGA